MLRHGRGACREYGVDCELVDFRRLVACQYVKGRRPSATTTAAPTPEQLDRPRGAYFRTFILKNRLKQTKECLAGSSTNLSHCLRSHFAGTLKRDLMAIAR